MADFEPAETGFGEELKRHRLLREVSLESIAAATKISVRHLQALERGDFAKLPAPVFTRGFIRAYAGFLGLDPEEMVNAYLSETGGAAPRGHDASAPAAARRPSVRAVVLGVVAGAVAILIAAAVWRSARRPKADDPRSPSLPPVALSPHIRQVAPPASASAAGEAATPSPAAPSAASSAPAPPVSAPPSPSPAASGGEVAPPLALRLSATGPCWSEIFADGRAVFSGIVRPGDDRRFEARKDFRITAGNAGALRLTVNGRPLPPLGRAGEVVRDVRIDADSLKAMSSRPE